MKIFAPPSSPAGAGIPALRPACRRSLDYDIEYVEIELVMLRLAYVSILYRETNKYHLVRDMARTYGIRQSVMITYSHVNAAVAIVCVPVIQCEYHWGVYRIS